MMNPEETNQQSLIPSGSMNASTPSFQCKICRSLKPKESFSSESCICFRCFYTCEQCNITSADSVAIRQTCKLIKHRLCENCLEQGRVKGCCVICEVCQICKRKQGGKAVKRCKGGKVTCFDCVLEREEEKKCGVCGGVLDDYSVSVIGRFQHWYSIANAITTIPDNSYKTCPKCNELVSIFDFDGIQMKTVQCPQCGKVLDVLSSSKRYR